MCTARSEVCGIKTMLPISRMMTLMAGAARRGEQRFRTIHFAAEHVALRGIDPWPSYSDQWSLHRETIWTISYTTVQTFLESVSNFIDHNTKVSMYYTLTTAHKSQISIERAGGALVIPVMKSS